MSGSNDKNITKIASVVMQALEGLTTDERQRIFNSVVAIYDLEFKSNVNASLPSETKISNQGLSSDKKQSLVEFLKNKEPSSNPQKIACFAYYLDKVEARDRFLKNDLLPMFATAKLVKPAYYQRDFNNAVREGWIHEDDEDCYLTVSGEKAVEQGFGGKSKQSGTTVKKSKKKK